MAQSNQSKKKPIYSLDRSNGRLNVGLMYIHRYLRLTPLLALAILVYMKILPLMSSGPIAETITFGDYNACERTWYLTLLYVQNYATEEVVSCILKVFSLVSNSSFSFSV